MDYKCSVKVYKVIENSPGKFATVLFESESISHKRYTFHSVLLLSYTASLSLLPFQQLEDLVKLKKAM